MKKKGKILLAIFIVVIILIMSIVIYFSFFNKQQTNGVTKNTKKETIKEVPKLNIIDLDSDSRPYSIMINNIHNVWGYQSGLNDAYIVYEMLVEGGFTRFLAVYKDKELDRIGTVRSSRHYFLDYALENDAIYVHFGWSPQAQSDIKSLNVDNINFMTYEGYIRDTSLGLAFEHTAFTTTYGIMEGAKYYNYRTTSKSDPVLNYSVEDVNLSELDSIVANNITLAFSKNHTTGYVYDAKSKTYKRYQNDLEHTDYVTKEQYSAKNIIIYQVDYHTIDSYCRQTIDNIGNGTGYYVTEGYAIPITWQKDSRSSKTVYKLENGDDLKVNDGNTYIEIQPKGQILSIS